jgi:hypothetical protein
MTHFRNVDKKNHCEMEYNDTSENKKMSYMVVPPQIINWGSPGVAAGFKQVKEKYKTITQLNLGTFMVMAEPAYVNTVVNAETNVDKFAEGITFGRLYTGIDPVPLTALLNHLEPC